MSYYRWAQRNSTGYAAKSFEQFWPDPVIRRSVSKLLASFVEKAASVTSAWTVVLDPDVVKLDVGGVQLLDLTPNRVWFCSTYLSDLPDWIEKTAGGSRRSVYKRVPIPSLGLLLEPAAARRLPAAVRLGALEYVRHAGNRWKGRSPWAKANSPGVIAFLNAYLGTQIDLGYTREAADSLDSFGDPEENREVALARLGILREVSKLPTLESVEADTDRKVREAQALPQGVRRTRLAEFPKYPKKLELVVTTFVRNQYVIAEVLARANGLCETCRTPAPFSRASNGTPYLEVHHVIPLATGGEDTVENAVALCPNCHRRAHYG